MLTVDGIKVRYRNGALGVLDISMAVEAGQVVSLIGPNGAGKTTTVRAVSGFLRSERARVIHGTVTFLGEQVTNREPHSTSGQGMAFVPERRKIFPNMSVAENLDSLGRRLSRSRRAELESRVFSLFPAIAQRRRELAGRLSGGQQQMVAIARSLFAEPRLLILDEMTLGLHHSMFGPLFDAVRQIASDGTSVIMVNESAAHSVDASDYCYLLSGGRVQREGPSSLFAGSDLLAEGYVDGS